MSRTNPSPASLVRELRGRLSHDKFAAALGTSRQTVIRWEKGTIPELYAQALADYSQGRYSPEDFDPQLRDLPTPTASERLSELERKYAALDERLRRLESVAGRKSG